MTSQLLREKRKITRNLAGIRTMNKLPGALVVLDVNREENALREARSLGIPTICLIDTDGNPELADIPIPGNDDSMRSIEVVMRHLCEAVTRGKQGRTAQSEGADEEGGDDRGGRRRSRRSQFSADAPAEPAAEAPAADAAPAAAPATSEASGS
jgi:small subunit ribosomal protein S2